MTPIERVARRLAIFRYEQMIGSSVTDEERQARAADWRHYVEDARAVLTAIREPSGAILKAMRDTVPIDGHEWEYVETDAVDHWKAMIDAALTEEG